MYSGICGACVCACLRVLRAHVVLKRTAPAERQQARWLQGSGVHFKTDALTHMLHVVMSPLLTDRPESFYRVSAFTRLVLLMKLGYVRWEKAVIFKCGGWRIFPKSASRFSSITSWKRTFDVIVIEGSMRGLNHASKSALSLQSLMQIS